MRFPMIPMAATLLALAMPAAAAQASQITPMLLGEAQAPPADGRYRAVYESTIALRNRLYGN